MEKHLQNNNIKYIAQLLIMAFIIINVENSGLVGSLMNRNVKRAALILNRNHGPTYIRWP